MKDIESDQNSQAVRDASAHVQKIIIKNYSQLLGRERRTARQQQDLAFWREFLRNPTGSLQEVKAIFYAEAEVDSLLRTLEQQLMNELSATEKAQSQIPKRYREKKEEIRLKIKSIQSELASVRYLLNATSSR